MNTLPMDPIVRTDPLTRLWLLRAVRAVGLSRLSPRAVDLDDGVLAAIGFRRPHEDEAMTHPMVRACRCGLAA